jgi:hypothetical protein
VTKARGRAGGARRRRERCRRTGQWITADCGGGAWSRIGFAVLVGLLPAIIEKVGG